MEGCTLTFCKTKEIIRKEGRISHLSHEFGIWLLHRFRPWLSGWSSPFPLYAASAINNPVPSSPLQSYCWMWMPAHIHPQYPNKSCAVKTAAPDFPDGIDRLDVLRHSVYHGTAALSILVPPVCLGLSLADSDHPALQIHVLPGQGCQFSNTILLVSFWLHVYFV